jgi:hypothetical protein
MPHLNPHAKPEHGLLIILAKMFLDTIAYPCTTVHNCLKEKVPNVIPGTAFGRWLTRRTDRAWTHTYLEGLVIEFWVIFWITFNVLAMNLLWYIPSDPWWIRVVIFVPVFLRAADLLRLFLVLNFYMVPDYQRSVARSYALLVLNFFEIAAIFSSIHLLFYKSLTENGSLVGVGSLYFYCITSMLTIDQATFSTPAYASNTAFYVLKVLQPIFGVLLLAMAIGRIIDWRSERKPHEDGNGG